MKLSETENKVPSREPKTLQSDEEQDDGRGGGWGCCIRMPFKENKIHNKHKKLFCICGSYFISRPVICIWMTKVF